MKEIKEIWYGNGNEDKCDVFVIPWKAVPISKYAAKELCGPIAYRGVEKPPLGRVITYEGRAR